MRTNTVFPLEELPVEVLFHVFSMINLENFFGMMSVSQILCLATQNNLFWQNTFSKHFPKHYKKLEVKNISNWYEQFSITNKDEYPDNKTRKLFFLAKEIRVEELKEILQFEDFDKVNKKNQRCLSQEIAITKNQPLLDHCYQVTKEYADSLDVLGFNIPIILLIGAARFNQVDKIGTLLTQPNINIQTSPYCYVLFRITIAHEHIDVINILFMQQLNPNVTDSTSMNETPLHIAALIGNLDITNALLANGANIDSTTTRNQTPLLIAVTKGHNEIVDTLLAHGANPDINHTLLMSPLLLAKITGNHEMALAIVKQQLRRYLEESNSRDDDDYTTYNIFNTSFNLSFFGACPAKQKRDAAKALARVYLEGLDEPLDAHEKALDHGKLKSIYQDLKHLTEAVESKKNSYRY